MAAVRTAEQVEAAARENAAIAQGLKRQDTELLDHLIDQYQHRLMRYLTFLTGRRETAEDLFQEQFRSRENAAEVAAVLLQLHPTYREVLVLRFHEELPLEEIASVTRSPLSTVKSRLYRGLAALKPEIERVRAARQADPGRGTC